MKKLYIFVLLAGLICLPAKNVKAQYDPGDVAALQNVMNTNFAASNLLNWTDPDPGLWLGVTWNAATPRRVVQLDLRGDGMGGGTERGTGWPIPMSSVFQTKYEGFLGSGGVDSHLTGDVDLSALSELRALDLRRQDSISGLNVSGLNKLMYFYMGNSDMLTSLDLSNLPNLRDIHIPAMNDLVDLNASNCPRLKKIKATWSNNVLQSINLAGSDSLMQLGLKDAGLSSLDVTGKTELRKLAVNSNSSLNAIDGLSTCGKLFALSCANNSLGGVYDAADFDEVNMYKFNIRNNGNVGAVNNWTMLSSVDLEVVGVEGNALTLDNATQVFNELNPNNNYNGSDQTRYGGNTIYVPGTVDHSSEALIDINGSDVASTFTLFNALGVQVGPPNNTGIFGFPAVADTGEYYIEMSNPGAAPASNLTELVTNNFWVRCQSGELNQSFTICDGEYVMVGSSIYTTSGVYTDAFLQPNGCDSLVITTLTVQAPIDVSTTVNGITMSANQSGALYQWVDCDNGNAAIAGATDQSYEPTVNGNYAVHVYLDGCSATSECITITTVSLDALASTGVRVYPNPVSDVLSIELDELNKNTSITILSVEGKQVYSSSQITSTKTTIDTKNWKRGLYIVEIKNEQGTSTVKLVK